jgi:hypothetical protein
MKRLIITASLLIALTAGAQTIHIHQTNGGVLDIPSNEVEYINFTSFDEDEYNKYGTYKAFETFFEGIYECIPHKESCAYCTTFNWGDDEIMNGGDYAAEHVTSCFDRGEYYRYIDNQNWLGVSFYNNTADGAFSHSLAKDAWNCIYKVNLGLAKLEKMVDATDEERDLVKGQLLFFRAWWHHQQIEWWGGIPYIDELLDPNAHLSMPRLSFKECAEKCAADYREAANLLPNDWDATTVGKKTIGNNGFRITKTVALGYLGKVLLWAASPMWANAPSGSINGNAQKGALKNGNTYKYDVELAMQAAEALGEAISYIESGVTPYELAEYNYVDIYNHERKETSITNYSDIFYTVKQNWLVPGSKEAMMRGTNSVSNQSNWNFDKLWGPKVAGLVAHDAIIHLPTANYVNYAYGMANGEPILLADGTLNPNSGFDATHPYKNRDPRFYHDIVFDGFKYVNNTDPLNENQKQYEYMQLYTGGNMVPTGAPNCEELGSRTGYFCQKLAPHQCNEGDYWYEWGYQLQCYLPYLRVADIYLLYAEAAAAAGGASYKANCNRTAEDAINVLRNRVGAGHVAARFVADQKLFIDEVRRERACELAFEGFRWQDLQRWLLLTEYPYNIKTREEFTRTGSFNYKRNDPRDASVSGFDPVIANGKQTVLVERNYDVKHYLLPLYQISQTFVQNPDW